MHMRRTKEIHDIDVHYNMEKIEEQTELDHLDHLLNQEDNYDISPIENRRIKSFTVSRINLDDKSPVISDVSPILMISEQKTLLISDDCIQDKTPESNVIEVASQDKSKSQVIVVQSPITSHEKDSIKGNLTSNSMPSSNNY